MPSTRRDFLKTTAATLAAGSTTLFAAPPQGQPVADDALPIIDTHQHLWDLSKLRLTWIKDEPGTGLNQSYLPADYAKATSGLNVVKTVYMEVDVDPSQQVQEAEYVLGLCADPQNPMAGAVISGRLNTKEFRRYIERFAKSPHLKGVREILNGTAPRGHCLQPQFVEHMQMLGELGLRFDLCMRHDEFDDAVKLVDQCPKTRFVVDHCGNLSVQSTDKKVRALWEKGLKDLAERENTVCKISGIIATAKKDAWKPADLAPNINYCLDTFGEDRVIFASDWPVCTITASLAEWVAALKEITRGRRSAFRRKLFHDNAVRFYGLA